MCRVDKVESRQGLRLTAYSWLAPQYGSTANSTRLSHVARSSGRLDSNQRPPRPRQGATSVRREVAGVVRRDKAGATLRSLAPRRSGSAGSAAPGRSRRATPPRPSTQPQSPAGRLRTTSCSPQQGKPPTDSSQPAAMPSASCRIAPLKMPSSRWRGCAPSAERMPISRVRCAIVNDIIACTPAAESRSTAPVTNPTERHRLKGGPRLVVEHRQRYDAAHLKRRVDLCADLAHTLGHRGRRRGAEFDRQHGGVRGY
jgi:hypothetical protein